MGISFHEMLVINVLLRILGSWIGGSLDSGLIAGMMPRLWIKSRRRIEASNASQTESWINIMLGARYLAESCRSSSMDNIITTYIHELQEFGYIVNLCWNIVPTAEIWVCFSLYLKIERLERVCQSLTQLQWNDFILLTMSKKE